MYDTSHLPLNYWLSLLIISIAIGTSLTQVRRSWAPGYIAVLLTIFAWYFIEPLYFPEEFVVFSNEVLEAGFLSVSVFLLSFVAATPILVSAFTPNISTRSKRPLDSLYEGITVERLLAVVVVVWIIVLSFGIYNLNGDLLAALFPIGGRSSSSVWMFGRAGGADAGSTGAIFSTADYLYRLCLGAFGLLLPIANKPKTRLLLVLLIIVSWPSVFLLGIRNVMLAVVAPFFGSVCLFTRYGIIIKAMIMITGFFAIDFALRVMVTFRNEGFADADFSKVSEAKHLGLNMTSELMHVTSLLQEGRLSLSYGVGYSREVLAMIPRVIWPDKPLIGIDYAIARGFGGAGGDLGVFATVSSGIIGQGVLDFGNLIGPIVAGLLMAGWVGILNRMRCFGGLLRNGLFLIGLGLTFNLGREISIQVLFPFLFAIGGVWIIEYYEMKRLKHELSYKYNQSARMHRQKRKPLNKISGWRALPSARS